MDVLLRRMSSFAPGEREAALRTALSKGNEFPPEGGNVNMHIHSFFSFNANGYSPSRIAWESRKAGLYSIALCDFDVLDGMEETYHAGELLGLRTAVHLETRVFIPELDDVDISSPGEPGVSYIMGAGFVRRFPEGSRQYAMLASFRKQAEQRNRELLARINAAVPELELDYEEDVLPLTPAGCATERHIVRAYTQQAESRFPDPADKAAFWKKLLRKTQEEAAALLPDRPSLEEAARSRLVKRGGLAYRQPTTTTFPPIDRFIQWVLSCRAIPMATWLDGTSGGEGNPERLLDLVTGKGVAAVNIIPDRNWNIAEPEQRRKKQRNLDEFVKAAVRRRLPINTGTEMNKQGLPFVDDLYGEVLRVYREPFRRGARIMVGHCILSRFADYSYVGEEADADFSDDLAAKNDFFESVGALPALTFEAAETLREKAKEEALAMIRDSVKEGTWTTG